MAKNKKKNKNNEEIYDDLPDKDINDDTSYDDTDYAGEVYDDETAYDDEADYDDDVEYPDDGEYSEDVEYEDGEEYSEDGQYEDGGKYSEDGEYEDGEEYSEDGEYEDGEEYSEDDQYEEDGEYSEDGQYEEDDQYDSDEAYVDDYQDNTDYKNNKQYIDDAFGDMWDERPEKKEYNGPKKPSVAPLVTCWILFAVLCVAYVYFFFIKDTSKDKGNTGNTAVVQDTEQTGSEAASTEEVSADVGKDNSVELDIPENASYKKCDDTAITDVINAFLTAKVNCDQDGLKSCVLETENYDDMSKVNSAAEFIKEYKNVTCYVADGYDDNGKVVFVLSNLVIADVDSNPLNIESFYVAKQSDGTYKINENRSTGIESYINNVIAKSDIQKIYAHVSDNVQYLYNNDPAFKDFYDKIHPTDTDNTGDGSSEEATSEDDSSSEADTQEGTEASTESAQ